MQASSKNLNLFNFSEKFDISQQPQQELMLENLLSNQEQMFGNFVGAADQPWILQNQPNRDEMLFGMGETGFQNV